MSIVKNDRKDQHLSLCLGEEIEFSSLDANGFGSLRFDHDALPELNRSEVELGTTLFGKTLAAPLIIGSMTGGTDRAAEINRRLALAAQKCRVGMALGSQRKMIENPILSASYAVREAAPSLPLLFGNVGAVQLNYGVGVPELKQAIAAVGCDAFFFHLNPLQESIQPEGDVNFSGLAAKLKDTIAQLEVPVLIKEVGAGISEATARKLAELPIAGVETAGLGGTSWAKIESLRAESRLQKDTGELFARWGVPTAESIQVCRKILPDAVIIGSGGMRNGIEAAKALALGANAVAMSLPMLKAAEKSVDAVVEEIERVTDELRTAMFVTGFKTVADLRRDGIQKLRRTRDFTAL